MTGKTLHISIEGNVACGKSTFLQGLEKEIKNQQLSEIIEIFPEPLSVWQGFGTEKTNLLGQMYSNPTQFSFAFQSVAMSSKIFQLRFSKPVNVVERSLFSQKNIFMPLLREKGAITPLELEILDYCIDAHLLSPDMVPDLYFYLQLEPTLTEQRLRHRNRTEENTVSLEYLQAIHEKHELWLRSSNLRDQVEIVDMSRPVDFRVIVEKILYSRKK